MGVGRGLRFLAPATAGAAACAALGITGVVVSPWIVQPSLTATEKYHLRLGALDVAILGVKHGEASLAREVREYARESFARGRLAAVAVESDTTTMQYISAAHAALHGLSADRVSRDGVGLVKRALLQCDAVHAKAGRRLTSEAEIVLPRELESLLRRGQLYAQEMAEGALVAQEAGVELCCLDLPVERRPRLVDAWQRDAPTALHAVYRAHLKLGLFAWQVATTLRTPGIAQALQIMKRAEPHAFDDQIRRRDEYMAAQIADLCASLGRRLDSTATSSRAPVRPEVVVVVGAFHARGIFELLCRHGCEAKRTGVRLTR